ncbi:lipase family protein [Tsukamurella serpentis]
MAGFRRSVLSAAAGAVVIALTVTACSPFAEGTQSDSRRPLPPLPRSTPAHPTGDADQVGEIAGRQNFGSLDAGVVAASSLAVRATYRSRSGTTGEPSVVSGSFFVPRGAAPSGGWPAVSFAHGTTGIQSGCGPSTSADLRGFASTVTQLLDSGYAVALTDYTGLGPDDQAGTHPYLEPRTAAHDVINAVRALRRLAPSVSNRWVAVGNSQGGQAAWAAAEHDPSYSAGLKLLGAATLAPAADISGIAVRAQEGTLSANQAGVSAMIVAGLQRAYGFDPSRVLSGAATSTAILGCDGAARSGLGKLRPQDFKPVTDGDTTEYRDLLRANSLPQAPLTAPLLVVNGDDDDVILPAWTDTAVARACALGGTVQHVVRRGVGHAETVPDAAFAQWIAERFADRPAPNDCGRRAE